ncbi:bifunctional glycosyltransferase/CDP-glycerol:glycerophosphate glycerophosphotransferase [Streptomyces sp. Ag109_O5-10]|uniref:bifunctional glycosyltransferase/CDP-glycerol:glycerophosphate glycerophosphotransferase n=1 Tax=Streptomyces sp. Ag109_O5-10 TaxID=1855349 RepID=UPI00089B9211|nr:bifunctional glycosyltransferase/CDP-glycerol:glycerophosphate glycerophosphotransferase [Streptomyces sp. Ag109_O5-10]SEF01862.1 CDP-glycerol glycerophosphotransferase, TagB/SpsB family [Streptomyces sp. Ag109_O5-10]
MPRLSVIIPCFKVQGFLRECLDSVLEQSLHDIEVIAVDDRSPDGSGAILDEYAARDPRVRVLHLPENVGLGRARNAGIPYATGDFLLFLDSDDTLTPGALHAVADRLAETGDPDVLVFDYARTYWWGGTRRNALAEVLSATDGVFTAAERPEILDLLMVVWNKAYRRGFVEENGFRFPPGYYEDTPWTFPVMLSAGRIATLDRICVNYRQRRQGSILSTTSRKHFDVHDQYKRVFAFVDAHPELAGWRPRLHRRMSEHCLDILAKPDRLPPAARAEFFRRTAELYRAFRPEGAEPGDLGDLDVLAGSYTSYRLREQAGRAKRAGGGQALRVRRAAGAGARRALTSLRGRRPLDEDLVLYSAASHQGLRGDPAAVYRAARVIAPRLRGVWVVRDAEVAAELPAGVDHVLLDSPEYLRLTARAKFFVNDVNWPGALVKRPGSVHVHTHRGTPLKYLGADLLGKPGARLGFDVPQMLRRADRWDHSLVANRHSELVWERAYPCHFASARTGSPRNDVLVTGGPTDFRARHGIPAGHTVVLYAPTRRDYVRGGHVDRIDLARFAADLGEGHTLVVRLHPALATGPARGLGLAELHRRGVVVDATGEPHAEEVMLASDALVTDYSSIMFDYANLDRPIVVHADDWPTYTASRGAYLDITAEAPGHVSRTYRELAWLFASGGWRDEESARLRADFRSRFCEFDDGRAAERVVRTLLLGEAMPDPPGRVPGPAGARDLLAST